MYLRLLFCLAFLCGCDETKTDHALFWRVEVNGKTSTLLGTMHGGIDANDLPQELWDWATTADVVVTEADVRDIDSAEYMQAVTLPTGETIRDHVTDDEWKRIVRETSSLYPSSMTNRLQPWYVHSLLIQSFLPRFEPMDVAFVRAAADAGVPLAFYETWQQQTAMLNALGVEDGLRELLNVVEDTELTRELLDEWRETYQAGDAEQIATFALHPLEMLARPRYYNEIVFGRNDTWLPTIEEQLHAGNAFIAVGFAHMLSDRGLLELLRQRGYRITKVK